MRATAEQPAAAASSAIRSGGSVPSDARSGCAGRSRRTHVTGAPAMDWVPASEEDAGWGAIRAATRPAVETGPSDEGLPARALACRGQGTSSGTEGQTVKEACGVFGVYAPGPGRRPPHLRRHLRTPAPRAGVRRHGGQRRRDHHRREGHGSGHQGLRRAHPVRALRATWPSATPATRPTAPRTGRPPSPSTARSAGPASPSATTAT